MVCWYINRDRVFKIILRIHRNDEMYSTKIRFATLYLISLSDLSVHDGGKSKTCASNAWNYNVMVPLYTFFNNYSTLFLGYVWYKHRKCNCSFWLPSSFFFHRIHHIYCCCSTLLLLFTTQYGKCKYIYLCSCTAKVMD